MATLSSLGGGPSHDHDEDDDDDDDDDESERKGPRDLFAGGEKSGLAVQDPARHSSSSDPKKVIKDILAKAKAYVSAKPSLLKYSTIQLSLIFSSFFLVTRSAQAMRKMSQTLPVPRISVVLV